MFVVVGIYFNNKVFAFNMSFVQNIIIIINYLKRLEVKLKNRSSFVVVAHHEGT